eukprot:m.261453 g.261453  ORF g.261453 m.261453 type:complete len:455 (-) comp42162_c0_seq1:267-1631(-)
MMATESTNDPEVLTTATHRSTKASDVDASEFPHLLKQYYNRLFPYNRFYRWLSYGNTEKHYFSNREFSFTLKDDVYIRYRSYHDEAEMTSDIKAMCPYKIDIGAIFSGKPKDHKKIKASEFKPLEKELVFDIDMTDYDEIRTCCSGAAICKDCWPFMQVAAKIIDNALREDFGFEHMLWVYSGRRGIHCWVCDKRARALSNEQRSAVAEWLAVVVGGEQKARQVTLKSPMFPSIERALGIAKLFFENWILENNENGGQDVLSDKFPESISKLLAVISDENIEKKLKERWHGDGSSSKERWRDLCAEIDKETKRSKTPNYSLMMRKQEIMLQYTYPRLDINVSKQLNHLLKSPFVVHPKTGRVCTPFDIEDIENFDPFTVPTISDLMRELDEYNAEHKDDDTDTERVVKNFEKTSLKKTIDHFDKFLAGVAEETRAERNSKRVASEMDAVNTGDW